MTTDEKLTEMENSIGEIMELHKENGHKLDEILGCLKGSDMAPVGLILRFSKLEDKVRDMESSDGKEKVKSEIYMSAIKWLGGIIAALVIAYMFNQIYTSKSNQQRQEQNATTK